MPSLHLLRNLTVLASTSLAIGACAGGAGRDMTRSQPASMTAAEQVRTTELAFAKTMADRDFPGFVTHLSSEAVFFDEKSVKHGAGEIAAAWKPLFGASAAPFAWAPDRVEVLASGTLALSTGPVTVGGKVVGRFNSIWRLEAPNTWRIVFDKGESVCAAAH
jgi:ketosteroid isomerase-like protein